MNCTNCGAQNEPSAKYCIKCGNPLANDNASDVELLDTSDKTEKKDITQEEPILIPQAPSTNEVKEEEKETATIDNSSTSDTSTPQIKQEVEPTEQNNVPILEQPSNVQIEKKVGSKFNYLMYLVAVFLKPNQAYKEEENNLSDTKNAFILTLIVSVVMTILGFIRTVISTVRVAQYDFAGGGYSYSWQWDNLNNIKFLQLIGKTFFIDLCIILAIAGAFYLGSLVIKKQINFIKSLSISASAMVPVVVGAMFLAPIASLIWDPLSFVFGVVGLVYSFLIFYELMNDYLQLNGDKKIWFNLSCISVLLIVVYYFLIKTLTSSI